MPITPVRPLPNVGDRVVSLVNRPSFTPLTTGSVAEVAIVRKAEQLIICRDANGDTWFISSSWQLGHIDFAPAGAELVIQPESITPPKSPAMGRKVTPLPLP